MATVDMFLKLDGIDGESTDSKHAKEVELDCFRFGALQSGKSGSATGGAGAGKVRVEDFHFRTKPSCASPKFYFHCCNGHPVKKATLTIRKAGKDQQEFLIYTFTDVLISSYRTTIGFDLEEGAEGVQWSLEGGATGTDDWIQHEYVSMNFGSLNFEYKAQKPDGTLGGSTVNGWDFTQNKSL